MNKKIYLSIFILIISITFILNIKPKEQKTLLKVGFTNQQNKEPIKENIIEKLKKEYQNNDIIATIEIKDTPIKGIIAQTKNNEYYLNYDLNKKRNIHGSLFFDYRNNIDNDLKLLVYGHMSSKNTTPFTQLKNYLKKDYFTNHQDLILTTKKGKYKYKVFAISIYNKDYDYLNLDFPTSDAYLANINSFLDHAKHKETFKFKPTDKTIFLQTCYPNQKGTYIILGAKLTKVYK